MEHLGTLGFAFIVIGIIFLFIAGSMKLREWLDPEYRARVEQSKLDEAAHHRRRRHH